MPLKIINHTPFSEPDGSINFASRVQGNLKFGGGWYDEMQAQLAMIERLDRQFNDRYTLLRNYVIPGPEITVPFILAGPHGILVIHLFTGSGIFQARGEQWLEFHPRKKEYLPAEPNPIQRALSASNTVASFLRHAKIQVPILDPVIFFTNPGVDIESQSPAVRLVRLDALNRFLQSFVAAGGGLSQLDVTTVLHIFEKAHTARAAAQPQASPRPGSKPARRSTLALPKFTNTQWIVLGSIGLFLVIIALFALALLLSA
jgi:hypothetical protein